jgi:hypothetical protein
MMRVALIVAGCAVVVVAVAVTLGETTSKSSWDWLYLITTGGGAIAVAFFTFRLWRSTERLWEASTEQAKILRETVDATMRAEGAVLVAEVVRFDKREQGRRQFQPLILYRISNYGRTPATVRRFQDRHRWVATLPAAPDFDGEALEEREERNIVLVPGAQTQTFACRLPQTVTAEEWEAERARRSHVIIRIEYEDIFGRPFFQGFALRVINEQPAVFQTVGGREYNYRVSARAA